MSIGVKGLLDEVFYVYTVKLEVEDFCIHTVMGSAETGLREPD